MRDAKPWLGAVVLAASFGACNSEPSKTPLQGFVDEFNGRYCAKLAPCCARFQLVLVDACGFNESHVNEIGTYSEEMGRRCLQELETLDTCSESRFRDAPSCDAIFPRYNNPLTSELGEPCNGNCNASPSRPNMCLPVAGPYPKDAHECQNHFGNQCDVKSHVCVAVIADGQPCTDSYQCDSPSYCKRASPTAPGTCQPREPAGADCSRDERTCDNLSWCKDGSCTARLADGATCDPRAKPDICLGRCGLNFRTCERQSDGPYYAKFEGFCVDPRGLR